MSEQEPPKIEFPCENYPVKIMGDATEEMLEFALSTTEQYAPEFDRTTATLKASNKGRFQSVTVFITATGIEQLQGLHQTLVASKAIKMVIEPLQSSTPTLLIRHLGIIEYEAVWQAMSRFTDQRDDASQDELWLVQHPPVFTQGRAGKPEHLLNPGDIPVIQSDRGGQVTYHGPGQLILYPLIQLKRYDLSVRDLVSLLEDTVVEFLGDFDVTAYPKKDAPGVYTDNRMGVSQKIASVGLRIRRGCSFHGVSINIAMDLSPFDRINPCGYQGLTMTQLREHASDLPLMAQIESSIAQLIANKLGAHAKTTVAELPA